jgi:hypothetical protein
MKKGASLASGTKPTRRERAFSLARVFAARAELTPTVKVNRVEPKNLNRCGLLAPQAQVGPVRKLSLICFEIQSEYKRAAGPLERGAMESIQSSVSTMKKRTHALHPPLQGVAVDSTGRHRCSPHANPSTLASPSSGPRDHTTSERLDAMATTRKLPQTTMAATQKLSKAGTTSSPSSLGHRCIDDLPQGIENFTISISTTTMGPPGSD